MEIVERILSKLTGSELTVEELETVSGGALDWCTATSGFATIFDGDYVRCDWE